MAESDIPTLTTLTVQLVSAYVSNNTVASEDLAGLIMSTRKALESDTAQAAGAAEPEYVPAVTIRKSLSSKDHIISMIDGKPYKTLKRHLSTHGLSPQEYRERYKLPSDYPLVAPSYSEHRRKVAERMGLGRGRSAAATAPKAKPAVKAALKPAASKKPAAKAKSATSPAKKAPTAATPATVAATPAEAKPKLKLKLGKPKAAADSAKPAAEPKAKPVRAKKAPAPVKAPASAAAASSAPAVAATPEKKPRKPRVAKPAPPRAPSVDPVTKP